MMWDDYVDKYLGLGKLLVVKGEEYLDETRGQDKLETTYPFSTAWDKFSEEAIRHLSLRLSASNTPMLPSQKVA